MTETTSRVATRGPAGISRAAIVDADRAGDRVQEAVEAATSIRAGVAVGVAVVANRAADVHPRAAPADHTEVADPTVPADPVDSAASAVQAGSTVEAGHRMTDRVTARRMLASRGKSVPAAEASAFETRAGQRPRVGRLRRPIDPAGVFPSAGEAPGRSVRRRASRSGSGTSHSRRVNDGQLGANLRIHLASGRRHPAHGRRHPAYGHTRRVPQGSPRVDSNRHRRI